jgi:hypothetical protein
LVKIKRFFWGEEARMRNFTSSSNVLLILLCYPEIRIIVGAGFIHPAFTIGYIHAINRRADKSSPYKWMLKFIIPGMLACFDKGRRTYKCLF